MGGRSAWRRATSCRSRGPTSTRTGDARPRARPAPRTLVAGCPARAPSAASTPTAPTQPPAQVVPRPSAMLPPFGAAYRWELVSGGYAPCGHIHHPRYVRNGHTAEGCPLALRARERAGEAISTRSVNVALSTTKRAGKLAGTYLGRFPTAAASTVSVVAPRIAKRIPLPTPTKTTHERSTAQPSPPGLSMNAESPTPTSGAYVWPAYAGWATSLDIAARACAASM
jgi:hypothetical protein